jgi:hypothetical protein
VAGFLAGLRLLNGACAGERARIIWEDLERAAALTHERGGGWLDEAVQALLERPVRPEPPAPAERRGWIYMFGDDLGRVKIGWTAGDPEVRRRSVESASGRPLRVLWTMRGEPADERALQDRFAGLRQIGEWFRLGPPLRRWLAAYGAEVR